MELQLRQFANARRRERMHLESDRRITHECLLIRAERRWSSAKIIEALADLMVRKGVPGLPDILCQ
jgi:hypothetical protein